LEMHLHQLDELFAARLRASGLIGAIEKIHDVFAGRTAMTAAMRNEKDVALAEEDWRQLGKPAGAPLAAVVPKDGRKWTSALGLVKEAVKNEISAGKGDFDGSRWGLSEPGYRGEDQRKEQVCEEERFAVGRVHKQIDFSRLWAKMSLHAPWLARKGRGCATVTRRYGLGLASASLRGTGFWAAGGACGCCLEDQKSGSPSANSFWTWDISGRMT